MPLSLALSDEREDSTEKHSPSGAVPQPTSLLIPPKPKLAPIASCETLSEASEVIPDYSASSESSESDEDDSPDSYTTAAITITTSTRTPASSSLTLEHFLPGESSTDPVVLPPDLAKLRTPNRQLSVPAALSHATGGGSSETLTHGLSTATSSDTLVPASPRSSPLGSPQSSPRKSTIAALRLGLRGKKIHAPPIKISSSHQLDALALSPATSPKFRRAPSPVRRATSPCTLPLGRAPSPVGPPLTGFSHPNKSPLSSPKLKRASSPICYSYSSPNIISNLAKARTGIPPHSQHSPVFVRDVVP